MLEISSQAEEAIRDILASEGVPEGAAFRISSQRSSGSDADSDLAVAITESAEPEDQIVEGEDVEIRVEPVAAEMLEDKQLDATVSDGQVQFSVSDQLA